MGMGRRNEWLLVSFTVATNLADAVTKVALPLLAVRLTDQPALIAAVAVLLTLPWLVTALHVGVLVDRLDRRRLMVAAETARIGAIAVLLGASWPTWSSLPLLYAVALALGVAEVVALTAGASIIPAAVPRNRWQTVTARITAAEYLCNSFVGAPVGGFLVAAGFGIALGATGVVYVVGAGLLLLIVGTFTPPPRRAPPGRAGDPRRARLPHAQPAVAHDGAADRGDGGRWSAWLALIPAYAVAGPLGLDERRYGFLLTALGAGGVVGTLLVGRINRLLGRRWSMFADIIGSFALVAVPALVPADRRRGAVGVAAFVAGVGRDNVDGQLAGDRAVRGAGRHARSVQRGEPARRLGDDAGRGGARRRPRAGGRVPGGVRGLRGRVRAARRALPARRHHRGDRRRGRPTGGSASTRDGQDRMNPSRRKVPAGVAIRRTTVPVAGSTCTAPPSCPR